MSQSSPESLDALRHEIDVLNRELLSLLVRRGELVARVAGLAKRGLAPAGQDAAREGAMVAELLAANPGPYTNEEIARIFRTILDVSLSLKQRRGNLE